MSTYKSHKDLDVWKRSIELVSDIYVLVKAFPDDEKFGMISQMRRAAVSIPANIAEGAGRQSKKEFAQFLYVALGSLAELDTHIVIAQKQGYVKDAFKIEQEITDIKKMLNGLIFSLKR
ncbi:MAG: four helix bundle protein [Candidatus Omnitrophica bacterium]|nr:four helix bundle protein [Candidatus Omnitrophota bacterium]